MRVLKLTQRSLARLFAVAILTHVSNAGVMAQQKPVNLPARFARLRDVSLLNTTYLGYVDSAFDMILAAGFAVVIDIHPNDEFKLRLAGNVELRRNSQILAQVDASALRLRPRRSGGGKAAFTTCAPRWRNTASVGPCGTTAAVSRS